MPPDDGLQDLYDESRLLRLRSAELRKASASEWNQKRNAMNRGCSENARPKPEFQRLNAIGKMRSEQG
jgi:hypothetical protein